MVEVGKIEIKKETVCQNKHSGLGLVAYGILNESESIDNNLVESFKDNELGLRCVSFKSSSFEGIVNRIRMNYQRESRLWFEVLKDVRVEEEVEYEG